MSFASWMYFVIASSLLIPFTEFQLFHFFLASNTNHQGLASKRNDEKMRKRSRTRWMWTLTRRVIAISSLLIIAIETQQRALIERSDVRSNTRCPSKKLFLDVVRSADFFNTLPNIYVLLIRGQRRYSFAEWMVWWACRSLVLSKWCDRVVLEQQRTVECRPVRSSNIESHSLGHLLSWYLQPIDAIVSHKQIILIQVARAQVGSDPTYLWEGTSWF